jgi:hypothetical protein
MDGTRQRPGHTTAPSAPEAMRHPCFNIPRKALAAGVDVCSGFMPWTDGDVNQTFAVTQAHGRQTLLAGFIHVQLPIVIMQGSV